ncbi:MAG: hypothetical protein Q9190_001976 [Brigantiaea leucoxantha]
MRREPGTFVLPIATATVFILLLLSCFTRAVSPPPGQLPESRQGALVREPLSFRREDDPNLNQERAGAVKEAFQHAWDGYSRYCFGQDEVNPVTNDCNNPRNSWGASAVDAFSTALVMQNQTIVNQILDFIGTIDFATTDTEVSLFETTIRYLAGMLSAYDLLKGPLSDLASNDTAVDQLLVQSKNLADAMSFAFNTATGIPHNDLNITSKGDNGLSTNGLATTGSLILEWRRLSDLSGDQSYGDYAQKAEDYLLDPKPASAEPFPGLLGTRINIESGEFEDATGGWNGGDDSFYEYLIKMYVYDPERYGTYRDRWVLAADSTIKYLTSHPSSRPDITFVSSFEGNSTFSNSSQHLTCFDGGSFLLGGNVLDRQDYIDFGLELVNGCHETYINTATRIGPEAFSWNSTAAEQSSDDDEEFFQKNGFYVTNGVYDLRPEVIESYYYAYRITKNETYRDWAWDAFVAINATCRTETGFTAISDVNREGGGQKMGLQESFLFAEVMKYAFLIHTDDADWQVSTSGPDEFVFNTEAHPIRVYLNRDLRTQRSTDLVKRILDYILM